MNFVLSFLVFVFIVMMILAFLFMVNENRLGKKILYYVEVIVFFFMILICLRISGGF